MQRRVAGRVAGAPADRGSDVADRGAGHAAGEHVARHVGHHATGERGRFPDVRLPSPSAAAATTPSSPAAAAAASRRPVGPENGDLHTGHGPAADDNLRSAKSRGIAAARHHDPTGL